jgi:hypothetical protein
MTFSPRIGVSGEERDAAVTTAFTFDPTTGELKYQAAAERIPPDRMLGAWIQRGAAGEKGATAYQVLMRGELQSAGVVQLPSTEHARLREGRFYLAVYTVGSPRGDARAQLAPASK